MSRRESDSAAQLRQAVVTAAMEFVGDSTPEFLQALAKAVLAAVAVHANAGEEHGMMADFLKAVRLGAPEAIERKTQLTAEYKRKKK